MRALLELLRIGLLPTAWSNVVAGFLIAQGGPPRTEAAWTSLGLTAALSSALFLGGMVINDAFDQDRDRVLHPGRPLPSGRIGAATAWVIGGCLVGIALALGWRLGPTMGALSMLLASAALCYNAGAKTLRAPGAALMGLCRALNLALGLTAGDPAWWASSRHEGFAFEQIPAFWPAPAALFGYIALVTWASTGEESGESATLKRTSRMLAIWLLMVGLALGVGALRLRIPGLGDAARLDPGGIILGAAALAALIAWILLVARRAARNPTAKTLGLATVSLLEGQLLLDAALIALLGPWRWCFLVVCAWPLVRILRLLSKPGADPALPPEPLGASS